MFKLLTLGASSLLGLSFALFQDPKHDGPPPPEPRHKKKKDEPRAKGAEDLKKAYDALGRLQGATRRDGGEERLRDWARRASEFYRKGIDAWKDGDERLAHEYGAMAHDLARAADHAANADRSDRSDDLPPPPEPGPDGERERTLRDLRHAYDRISDARDRKPVPDAQFYLDAARDLYRAARRDAEDGRFGRAGELARAAEAMTHVPEHMAHVQDGPPPPPDHEKAEKKDREKREKRDRRPEPPEARRDRPRGEDLPPRID